MELFYNPDLMPEEEIKATFVARQGLIDELISLIKHQPDGAGVQHVVIIAPRGMGKTTVLLMVRFAIKDRGLAGRWQAVKFPEESYGINDLADFWIEVLTNLAAETNDPKLSERAENLKTEYPKSDDLQEAALAVIKDWRRNHKKRLVLLVDNFDTILEQINDERDNARLRDVLMNDGTMMLIGGATAFFNEARAYDQPLYNFFKIYNLDSLRFAQMEDLLRQRADFDKRSSFEETLKTNAGRLRALEYFTGGNPRLVLMLYRIITQSNISEVQRGLEKLLDEVTPYYKAKIESLPPQQRKILDHIARVSSKTSEGLTPTEIAEATRLTANQVSSQLKRLSDDGYVRAANLRGRSSYYTLSEPLYAIWHQMRFGRDARQRMQWLIDFLKLWYDAEEIGSESKRLESLFREHLSAGRFHEAQNALEYRRYLTEAMSDSHARASAKEGVIRGYLELATAAFSEGRMDEALEHFDRALDIEPNLEALFNRGATLSNLGRYEEAIESFDRALKIKNDLRGAWYYRGNALGFLKKYEEAIASYDRVLEIKPDDHEAWFKRGVAFYGLRKHEEAIASYDRALEIKPDKQEAWHFRAISYLFKFVGRVNESIVLARNDWNEALSSAKHVKSQVELNDEWHKVLSVVLLVLAESEHEKFARQLIRESDLEDKFFPLARAIDYLLTGDDALIEKLSPEVRGIVEEIVNKLRKTAGKVDQPEAKSRPSKSKSGSRRRTRKQLH